MARTDRKLLKHSVPFRKIPIVLLRHELWKALWTTAKKWGKSQTFIGFRTFLNILDG